MRATRSIVYEGEIEIKAYEESELASWRADVAG